MIERTLEEIGLTKGEIKVYLALLTLGSSSIGEIIKKSGVSGSKTYEILDKLANKGLVSFILKNNVKIFEVSSPDKISDYLDEKQIQLDTEKKKINSLMPSLMSKYKKTGKNEVKVFSGWEGIKTVNSDIINSLSKGEEWLSMGLTEQPKTWEIYFNKKQKERARKGIIIKHLLNQKYKTLFEKRKKLPYTQIRFLPFDFGMPTSTEIYKNKIAIILLVPENPYAIVIESKEVSESYRKYFTALWKFAGKK